MEEANLPNQYPRRKTQPFYSHQSSPLNHCKSETHPTNNGKSFGLNICTSARPRSAMKENSLPHIYNRPARINASATRAVVLSFARLRTRARGRKITSCRRIKYSTGQDVAQLVIPSTNAYKGLSSATMLKRGTDSLVDSLLQISCMQRRTQSGKLQSMIISYIASRDHIKHRQYLHSSVRRRQVKLK
jgi:hypothetical protein